MGAKMAVKVMHRELSQKEHATRLWDELQKLAATGDEHFVRVYDCGYGEDGDFFFLMDELTGVDTKTDRIVEITSSHAMLGCAVAGMGISLMPRNVLTTFPDAKLLSTHSLPAALARAQTSLIWRKGTLSPKVRALIEVLNEHSDTRKKRRGARNNTAYAAGNGRSRA